MRFLSFSCLRSASCKPQHHGQASNLCRHLQMLPRGPTSPRRAPLTLLFSSQPSFDTDHFCSPPFVCPARVGGLRRPLRCSQAFGADIGNQRSQAHGSIIGSSISWVTSTVKWSSREPLERSHDETMIMPHNTLRQTAASFILEKNHWTQRVRKSIRDSFHVAGK